MSVLLADIVWPALFLIDRMWAIEVVCLGLILESTLFRYAFRLSWRRAILTTGAINLLSSIVGLFVIPAWGWHWESFVHERNRRAGWGTFNDLTWAETCVMAWLLTTIVESLPLRLMVGRRPHLVVVLLLANALSVGVAYVALWFLPERHDPWDVFNRLYELWGHPIPLLFDLN